MRAEDIGFVLLEEERLELEKEGLRRVKVSDQKSGVYEERMSRLKPGCLRRVSRYEGLVQPTVGEDGEPERGVSLSSASVGQCTWHVNEPGAGGAQAEIELKGGRHRLEGNSVSVEAKRRG
jgi:hypothetical protein